MRRVVFALVLALAATVVADASADQAGSGRHTLVQLERAGTERGERLLLAAGAELVVPELRLWRLSERAAVRLRPRLAASGALALVAPERTYTRANHITSGDPLVPGQWWLRAVGADRVEPPPPGRPIVVIDRGLDLSHPEFVGRPATTALNTQTVSRQEFHGTAVSSVAAAPANGTGLVGVYPQADLRSWDASSRGTLTGSEMIAGIVTASRSCPGVINLSLGTEGNDPVLQQAVAIAVRRGCIVVAAAGNFRESGSPRVFPASLPHVLTVGSTGPSDRVSPFSSASRALDLAAPGEDIWAALPFATSPVGYELVDGTSFSAPIVAGATAWVWTARGPLDPTQVFELMRGTARDVGTPGYDRDTGFGIVDIPSALSAPVPAADPLEPNEDVPLIRPGGLFTTGTAVLRGAARLLARLDVAEDPADVYRVNVPARRAVTVTVRGDRNVNLSLWRTRTATVRARGTARRRNLIGSSSRPGTAADAVRVVNRTRRAQTVYAHVAPGRGVGAAAYTLRLTTARP